MFFSIVIPVYNRSATIERCINSVIGQSFSEWELLLIDDGSSDDSVRIAAQFTQNDTRIKLLQRPPGRKKGANACRNIGIENAVGKYIAFLDSDDEWRPNRLRNAYYFLSNNKCKAIYSGAVVFNGEIEVAKLSRQISLKESPVDFLFSEDTFAQTSSLVVERELSLSIKFDESLLRNQDYDFFIRIHLHRSWVFYDSFDVLVHWLKGETRNYHFTSNITFIEKHKYLVNNLNLLFRYLYNNWLLSSKVGSIESEYFLIQMKNLFFKVDFRNKLRFVFRKVMFLYHLKKKSI